MKYDFTTIIERRGKDAIALDALGEPRDIQGFPGRDLIRSQCGLQI